MQYNIKKTAILKLYTKFSGREIFIQRSIFFFFTFIINLIQLHSTIDQTRRLLCANKKLGNSKFRVLDLFKSNLLFWLEKSENVDEEIYTLIILILHHKQQTFRWAEPISKSLFSYSPINFIFTPFYFYTFSFCYNIDLKTFVLHE